jgi:hypothetical protein
MSQEEIDGFVARLFDKDPLTARPDTLPLPYSDENPPPLVRITILLITFFLTIYTFLWLVTHDLYPDWEIDVALSDETMPGRVSLLAMMPEVTERLRLRPSLLIRSDQLSRGNLPLSCRLGCSQRSIRWRSEEKACCAWDQAQAQQSCG